MAVADHFVPEVLRAGLAAVSCGPAADFAGFATDGLLAWRYGDGRVFDRNAEETCRTYCPLWTDGGRTWC